MRRKSADVATSADWSLLEIDGMYEAILFEALAVGALRGSEPHDLAHEALLYLVAEVGGRPAVWRDMYRRGGVPYVAHAASQCMVKRAQTEAKLTHYPFNPFVDGEGGDDEPGVAD